MALRKDFRLRKNNLIKKVIDFGKRYGDSCFIIYYIHNSKKQKFAICFSKKIDKSHKRIKIKRKVTEMIRIILLNEKNKLKGFFVLIVKENFLNFSFWKNYFLLRKTFIFIKKNRKSLNFITNE